MTVTGSAQIVVTSPGVFVRSACSASRSGQSTVRTYAYWMYPPPSGANLTAEQRQELDDTFLSSDPYAYFSARIEMLLRWADSADDSRELPVETAHDAQNTAGRFARLLGRSAGFISEASSPRSLATQVATDAYTLRHHAAESLVRLTSALSPRMEVAESCVWEALSTGPNRLDQVVDQLRASFSSSEAPMKFARLVLRGPDLQGGMTERLASASNVFADWFQFAIDLLMGHELQLNAAHNKVKHGLSVRARDDLKVSFATTPPSADGTITISALTGPDVIDIFDRPVIEVLAKAPKIDGHQQGLELTQLRVDVPTVLAETYMIAWAHGAMFHVAAARHFEGRPNLFDFMHAPAHPGYPLAGPKPDHISSKGPVGMRFPLTTPPGGGPVRRPAGIAFRDSFIPLTFTGTEMHNVRVVAGDETEA